MKYRLVAIPLASDVNQWSKEGACSLEQADRPGIEF